MHASTLCHALGLHAPHQLLSGCVQARRVLLLATMRLQHMRPILRLEVRSQPAGF